MIYLKSITLKEGAAEIESFPFNLPVVRTFEELEFNSEVTFLVGENGSGKSTVLEAIAAGCRSVTVGSHSVESDQSLENARSLSRKMTFSWTKRTHKGFFLRAEDFFGYIQKLRTTKRELDEVVDHIDRTSTGYGRQLARGAVLAQKDELSRRYGDDLDANSHGESFLKLFRARFVPNGLYLLDEPEAPLSPKRQIALLSMLMDMVGEGAQFIIATHAPILMAFPGATIISFDSYPIRQVALEDTEHYFITRSFLENPERYLKYLTGNEEREE
jgi:predicted ATPase